MSKIKLMHLVQSAGYGVTIYVESLIKGLGETGKYEQCLFGSEYYNQPKYQGMVDKLITIPMDRNITPRDLKTIIKCNQVIRKEKPEILYCHSAKAGIYGRLACLFTKTKVVYNPHGWSFNMKCSAKKKTFYKLIEAIFAPLTNKIIAISDYEKKSTPSYIPADKIMVVKNGIMTDDCERILAENDVTREKVGIPKDAFVVGIIARISEQKGQDLLVEAAKTIKKEIKNAHFLIVGGKSDDIDIEEMIKTAGLEDCFTITGEVEKAVRYAALFDVAVLSSRWEGFGLVLAEYMVARKPIVAYAVDAIPEVVRNEENGLLVEAENTEALANAVIRLHNDKELCMNLSERGYRIAKNEFDLKRVIMEQDKLFCTMLKK